MFAALWGPSPVLRALLLQSFCFAASALLHQSKVMRLALLTPILFVFSWASTLADVLLYIPPLLYLVYLTWQNDYQLSWERQVGLFKMSLRIFVPIAFIFAIVRFHVMLTTGIPAIILTALASILLMRSLRHDSTVYLHPRYQFLNAISILLLAAIALALSSECVLQRAGAWLVPVYNEVIVPLFASVAMLIGVLFLWIPESFRQPLGFQDPDPLSREPTNKIIETEMSGVTETSGNLLKLVAVAIVIVVCVSILRWIIRRWRSKGEGLELIRRTILRSQSSAKTSVDRGMRTNVSRIRYQYQIFLQVCRKKGISVQPADTSTDISEKSLSKFSDETSLRTLRDIYQEARYHGVSSREDYQKFKQALKKIKSELEAR